MLKGEIMAGASIRLTRVSIQGEGPVLACPVPILLNGILTPDTGPAYPVQFTACLATLADAEDPGLMQDAIDLASDAIYTATVDYGS
jgi:hypothetical protein